MFDPLMRNPQDRMQTPGAGQPTTGPAALPAASPTSGGPAGGAWNLFSQMGGQQGGGQPGQMNPLMMALYAMGSAMQGGGGSDSGMKMMMMMRQQQLNQGKQRQAADMIRRLDPKLGALVDSHIMSPQDAYKIHEKRNAAPTKNDYIVVGKRLFNIKTREFLDPTGSDVSAIYDKDFATRTFNWMGKYKAEPAVKEYRVQRAAYEGLRDAVRAIVESPGNEGISDMTILYNYIKSIDPGGRITDNEVILAGQTTNVPGQIINIWNNMVKTGGKLNDQQRQAILRIARGKYLDSAGGLADKNIKYARLAKRLGIPAEIEQLDEIVKNDALDIGALRGESIRRTKMAKLVELGYVEPPEGLTPAERKAHHEAELKKIYDKLSKSAPATPPGPPALDTTGPKKYAY